VIVAGPSERSTPRWVRAIAHPTRIAILAHLLEVREASPIALSRLTGVPLGSVAYHVRCLRDGGQLVLAGETMARGAVAHHYRLADPDRTRQVLTHGVLAEETEPEPDPGSSVAPVDAPAVRRWGLLMAAIADLAARRQALGLTREEVAARIHVKPSLLAGIERGDVDPRLTTLLDLAEALDTTLGEVFACVER